MGSFRSIGGMKKAKTGKKKAAAKRAGGPRNIDEYLAGVAEPARSTLRKVRAAIRSAVPKDATETISYGIPAFRSRVVLVWFAAFRKHCSLFPTVAVIEEFRGELKPYTVSKGTIQFPAEKALPESLVKKLVKARVAMADAKKKR